MVTPVGCTQRGENPYRTQFSAADEADSRSWNRRQKVSRRGRGCEGGEMSPKQRQQSNGHRRIQNQRWQTVNGKTNDQKEQSSCDNAAKRNRQPLKYWLDCDKQWKCHSSDRRCGGSPAFNALPRLSRSYGAMLLLLRQTLIRNFDNGDSLRRIYIGYDVGSNTLSRQRSSIL